MGGRRRGGPEEGITRKRGSDVVPGDRITDRHRDPSRQPPAAARRRRRGAGIGRGRPGGHSPPARAVPPPARGGDVPGRPTHALPHLPGGGERPTRASRNPAGATAPASPSLARIAARIIPPTDPRAVADASPNPRRMPAEDAPDCPAAPAGDDPERASSREVGPKSTRARHDPRTEPFRAPIRAAAAIAGPRRDTPPRGGESGGGSDPVPGTKTY